MTTKLRNRTILPDGTVICQSSAMVELLYKGKTLESILCNDIEDQTEWQEAARICDDALPGPVHSSESIYDGINWYDYWLTPDPYNTLDIHQYCIHRCKNNNEIDRVNVEIRLMEDRNMIPILRHLVYCMDVWRKNNIFWGVGRGSSVCSLVLYLIGINRINPLEYDLDIKEWLR